MADRAGFGFETTVDEVLEGIDPKTGKPLKSFWLRHTQRGM